METTIKCLHEKFECHSKVGRLSEEEGGEITSFVADIKIRCTQCGMFFEFVGLPAGSNKKFPTTNFDFTELRAPIRPFTGKTATNLHYQFAKDKPIINPD